MCEGELSKVGRFMLEEERVKLCREERELMVNEEKKGWKLFLRWCRDVLLGNWVYEKLKGRDGLILKNEVINEKR